MPNEVGNVLTQKIAGVPAYVWVGVVGIGGGLVIWYVNRRSATSAAVTGQAPGAVPSSSSALPSAPPVTYITGVPGFAQPGASAATGSTSGQSSPWTAITRGPLPGFTNIPILGDVNGKTTVGSLQPNTSVQLANAAPVSGTWPGEGQVAYYQVGLPGGGTGFVLAQDLSNVSAQGMGAGVSQHSAHGASPWQAFSQRWHAPTYMLGGMGGGAGGAGAHLAATAKHTRIPRARLLAANPPLRRQQGRVNRTQLVRIA